METPSYTRPPELLFHCKASRRKSFHWTEGEYDTFIAVLVENGRFRYTMRGDTKEAGKNNIVFFPAHEPFKRTVLEPLVFHHLCFDTPCVNSGWDMLCGKYSFEDKSRIESSARMLTLLAGATEIKTLSEEQKHIATDILSQLVIEQKINSTVIAKCSDPIVDDICNSLRTNISAKVNFDSMARQYGMTQVQFIRRFSRAMGTTPGKYLTEQRLELGYRLLSGGAVTVSEAAELCGYESQFYFSQCFKKRYNITPTEAKSLNRK